MLDSMNIIFEGIHSLALAIIITLGIGILFCGSALISGYLERRKRRRNDTQSK